MPVSSSYSEKVKFSKSTFVWKVIELSRNYLDRDVERKTETWRERQRKTDGIMRKFLIYGGNVTKIQEFQENKVF